MSFFSRLFGQSTSRHDSEQQADCKPAVAATSMADGLMAQAVALHRDGDLSGAEAAYRKVLRYQRHERAYGNLGMIYIVQERFEEALPVLRAAVQMRPNHAHTQVNLGVVLSKLGYVAEAIEAYATAAAIAPETWEPHANLGNLYLSDYRPDEAMDAYWTALRLNPQLPAVFQTALLGACTYSNRLNAEEVFAEQLRFGERLEGPLKPSWLPHHNPRDKNKRLKLGYVSADFNDHPVMRFMEPMLACHDKAEVELFCYYNNDLHDALTERTSALVDHWLACPHLSDDELAQQIRADGIDVLVDLSGVTKGHRLGVFARKPAPVQMTWIGCPSTTGMRSMDYRLTDAFMDPKGVSEQFNTETLIRLPISAIFKPPANSPPVNTLPALSGRPFTFACLNRPLKINSSAVKLWARILDAVPQSRMTLGYATDDRIQQRLLDQFAQEGVDPERIVPLPLMSTQDYLAAHNDIDLALDTFPYSGGTTTCYSAWMGVPVITLGGLFSYSRASAATMSNIGLAEFVARDEDDYVRRAVAWTQDLAGLDAIRQSLRARMPETPEADPSHLVRHVEQAFRAAWIAWCDSQASAAEPI